MPNINVPNIPGTIVFRDVDNTFQEHPSTSDVRTKTNVEAIKQSVRNIVSTGFGEKPFHPEFGCGIRRLLFEPLDSFTRDSMFEAIRIALENFEPRVRLLKVDVVESKYDNNELNITVLFQIRNDKLAGTQEVTSLLKRVR